MTHVTDKPQGVPSHPLPGDGGGSDGWKNTPEQTSQQLTDSLREASMGRNATKPFPDGYDEKKK